MTNYVIKAVLSKSWFRKPKIKYQVLKHCQEWVYGHFDCDLRDSVKVVATFDYFSEAYTACESLNNFKGEKP
jgi:hypothetical protein